MTRALVTAFALCALACVGCDNETFEDPILPDLYKVPYDFSAGMPPAHDLGAPRDLSTRDLTEPHD